MANYTGLIWYFVKAKLEVRFEDGKFELIEQ